MTVGGESRQGPEANRGDTVESVSSLLVLKPKLQCVVADVGRTGGRNTELTLVKLAEPIALASVVVPKSIGVRCALAVEEGVVLNGQEVVVRPIKERSVLGSREQVEVLLGDSGQLWIEQGRIEINGGVFPADVAENVCSGVVLVAVLLIHIEAAEVTVLHQVVAMGVVFGASCVLGEVDHDLVVHVAQTALFFSLFGLEAL